MSAAMTECNPLLHVFPPHSLSYKELKSNLKKSKLQICKVACEQTTRPVEQMTKTKVKMVSQNAQHHTW